VDQKLDLEADHGGYIELVTGQFPDTVQIFFVDASCLSLTIPELIKLRDLLNTAINRQHLYQNTLTEEPHDGTISKGYS
jgi:hypothetical protein